MALIVHKYGGTSMGSPERIQSVARRVAKWARAGHRMVVVPSAMSGETNRLLALAKQVSPEHSTPELMRELDMIASTGEQVSVGLLSIALQAEGLPAVSYAGWQVPIATDSRLHQGPDHQHRGQADPRRSRCRQGGGGDGLPGRRPTATSPPWAAAAPTPRRWRWRRR